MRPKPVALLSMATLLVLASGCGKARSNPPALVDPNDVVGGGGCYPLGHAALARSLDEPLALGRDQLGTLYALSRAGSTPLLWRALDQRLVAYPVVAENRSSLGAIFGADDGNQGFALTLQPEAEPTLLRVFQSLADAAPSEGTTLSTGGATLELLPPSALSDYTVASEISPALLAGSFRTVADGAPSASLLLVRTEPAGDAPLAVFYGDGNVLEQRTLVEWSNDGERQVVRFRVNDLELAASIYTESEPPRGLLVTPDGQRTLQQGVRSALGLAQLEFRCASPVPTAWTRAEPPPAMPEASCNEALPLFACAVSTGIVVADTGTVFIPPADARVLEVGEGLATDPRGYCGRAATLADDPRVTLHWAHLEYPGGELWLTVAGPELELPLRVGQNVSVTSWDEPGFTWETWQGELTLRSAEGELMLWMGQAEEFSRLNGVPEFSLLPGPERCITVHECGSAVSQYALATRLLEGFREDGLPRAGSEAQLVGYGERARQGDYYVYNGGIEAQTAAPQCAFKYPGNTRTAIWKPPRD